VSYSSLPQQPTELDPSQSKWKRVKAVWAVVASIIAVSALVLSILTYLDQHQAHIAATLSAEQAYAEKVSYYLKGNGDSEQIVVENLGESPVSNVMLTGESISSKTDFLHPGYEASIHLGALPQCSRMTASFLYEIRLELVESFWNPGGPAPMPGISSVPLAQAISVVNEYKQLDGFPIGVTNQNVSFWRFWLFVIK
jgi:hypothetical protein